MTWISIIKCKVNFWKSKHNIFVKIITNHPWNSLITPSSMNQQQFLQTLKLIDSKICRSNSLSTLHTSNTNSNMSLHNHWNIVCSISNWNANTFLWLHVMFNDIRFLFWRHSATNNWFRRSTKLEKLSCDEFISKDNFKGWSIDHNWNILIFFKQQFKLQVTHLRI